MSALPAAIQLAADARAVNALAVIAIPWDPSTMSANQRMHWRKLDGLKKKARAAASLGWKLAGCPVLAVPVYVDVLIFRCRRLDDDNATSGLKTVRDQLCDTKAKGGHAMLPDDTTAWWMYREIEFVTGALYGKRGAVGPWTLLTLRTRG